MHFRRRIPPWELLHKALPDGTLGDFEFDLPMFLKSAEGSTGRRIVQGVASTPAQDLQEEEVVQKGLDLRYFLKYGYYNDDHKPGPENKVGQPTEGVIKNVRDVDGKTVLGLWTRGFIWPKGAHQGADHIWELAKALEAAQSDRRMGFSIQGKILRRERKRIIKAWIQDIAITASPVNTKTWMEVVEEMRKSQWATTDDVDDLKRGINGKTFLDDPIIEEPWDGKALTSASASALQVESLEENMKRIPRFGDDQGQDEVSKALGFAYNVMKQRGYGEEKARGAALAAVARTLLQ